MNIVTEIEKLRKEKNAIILAHYYQEPAIQDIADYVGDSLGLSQKAAHTDADIIVFAGVYFMAETAKILNPDKKVLIPDIKTGCSLVESCPNDEFENFTLTHPDHYVITYINSSVEVKAMSDIICTSSNAVKIIKFVPKDQPVIFAPDKNLGKYLIKKTGRELLLWEGACIVHEAFSMDKLIKLSSLHPEAKIIAHPESEDHLLTVAHFIGSTSAMLNYVKNDHGKEYIVATEAGILHQMLKDVPGKKIFPAPVYEDNTCSCSECPYMKLNTLKKLYLCLKYEKPEVVINEEIRLKALKPIDRMLRISA